VPLAASGERKNATAFQAVFMDVSDPNDKGQPGTLGNDCVEECFDQFVPFEQRGGGSSAVVEQEPSYDYQVPALKTWDVDYQNNLTAQVFLEMLEDSDGSDQPLSYIRSVKLLRRSMEIMRKICMPYISQEFTDQILKGFLFLVQQSKEEVLDIGELENQEITKALERCAGDKSPAQVKIVGTVCNNYTRIIGYGKPDSDADSMTKYKIEAKSFRWLNYDPIIEGTWAAIDFVHGYCFPGHLPDLNYHHIYQTGLEALFTKTILQRWPNPPQLKRGPDYWNNILDTRDAKLMMQNVDACVQAGYFGTAHERRLNRPFVKYPELFADGNGKASNKPKPVDRPDYLQDSSSYWKWYAEQNGLQSYLETVGGVCITKEDDLNTMRTQCGG
jgi:hypothetical protein